MFRKNKKLILAAFVIVLGLATWYAYNEYTRKPLTSAQKDVDFTLSAEALMTDFNNNEKNATDKYLNKNIEITGKISSISKNKNRYDITFETSDPMSAVTIQLIPDENSNATKIKEGDEITARGFCNGKLSDIELNKGVIIKK